MIVTSWFGGCHAWGRIYCVAYYKDPWDHGLTYSHREFWF